MMRRRQTAGKVKSIYCVHTAVITFPHKTGDQSGRELLLRDSKLNLRFPSLVLKNLGIPLPVSMANNSQLM